MGNLCAQTINNDDVQTLNKELSKTVLNKLKALNVSTEGLTKEETIAVISSIMTEKGYTQETVMDLITSQNKRLLNDAVANARIKKMQEQKALANNKIGNAEFVVGERLDKGDPRAHRDTLYIFTDNLQASNEVFGDHIGDTIEVLGGVKLNVKATSAIVRTDANGDINPNAVGLVTKKNAQNQNGVFIAEEGFFQDTDEDFATFEEANQRAINKIKEMLFGEDSPYTKISMVDGLATSKAALPERFADKLADMLETELGISTQKVPNGKGFGLKVMKMGKSKKNKDKIIKQVNKKIDDILESYLAERPKLDSVIVDPNDRSLLSQIFPNIEMRIARVSFISESFSRYLSDYIDTVRNYYSEKEDRTEIEQYYYQGLTSKTRADQRVFALKEFKRDGEPLGSYILNLIKSDLIAIAKLGTTEEGITTIANELLEYKGVLGKDFKEEIYALGYNDKPNKATQFAYARARYLAQEYAKMAETKVFNALCRDAAIELDFNENIRFDLNSLPIETEDDINEDEVEENKENANKEGYMIKYKLEDPAKSLTLNIKALLGSLYKRDYRDINQYVFNDLGGRVRMDALTAYRILLDEFSVMKKPEDLVPTLDKAIEKYPWLYDLRDKLVFNPLRPKEFNQDLVNEFYRSMRKAQVPYGMISEAGLLTRLNRSTSSEDILDNVRSNYEGHIVLGPKSIYTETGEANIDNCIAIHKLFSNIYDSKENRITGKGTGSAKQYAFYKKQPLGWALSQLRALQNNRGIVDNVIKAINILAGLSEDHERINLNDILKNVGIDTSKMNIDSLFGDIPFLIEDELSEIKTIDDLMEHISENQVARLISVLESINTIVNQRSDKKFQSGDYLLTKFQNVYLKLGSALTLASDGYTAMTFRHNGSMRSSYAAPDFISDLVGIISNTDSIEEANEWLENNYGKFDFFKDPVTKEWMNTWLKDFFDPGPDGDYPFRKNFEYINILSFMGSEDENSVGKIDKNTLLTGLVHAFFSTNDDNYGYYRSPLLSDVDACVLIKGTRYTGEGYQDKILKGLVKVVLQEVNRINSIEASKDNPDTVKIEFYNSTRLNGIKFQYLPELNSRLKEILKICTINPGESPVEFIERRDEELKIILKEFVDSKVERFLDNFSDRDKLAMYQRIAVVQARNNKTSIKEALEEEQPKDTKAENERKIAKMDERLTEFYYNDFFAQSQIQQLLGGDLAFYKNYIDFVKRNKQAYACGDRLYAREVDEKGNIIGNLIETAIYLEDEDVITNSYESLKNLLMSSNMKDSDKAVMRFALEQFRKITSTDGQSFRTIDSFKKIFKAKGGTWTEDMERAYQNIKNGTITAADFLALWNPIKPFYYGHESINTGNRNEKVVTQHKNSEYMITALYSFLNTALNKSPKLVGLHQFMVDHNIDVVHFHSVVKEGFNSPFDIRYNKAKFNKLSKEGKITLFGEPFLGDYKEYMKELTNALDKGIISQEEFNSARDLFEYQTAKEVQAALEAQSIDSNGNTKEIMFKRFPMDSYMIVQPSGDHLVDAEAIFGTQLKNIIMADLPEDFSITIPLNGKEKTLNREEAVRFYNSLLVDNMLDAFSKVSKEFSNIEALQKALFEKMENNPKYGDDVKAALQLNDNKTGFVLPFNSPTLSNKIEELVLSTFKNAIQRQKIKGGNAVLVSNFGLHDDLHVVYKDGDKKKGVEYIEAYLPAFYSSMFKDFLVQKGDYQEIDFNKMEKALGKAGASELLNIIGYRIPTEDKYSIMPIRIKGFMPVVAGTTIMLPADIITMSGTDFDIDKLFLMIKEFDRITYPSSLSYEFKTWLENKKKEEAEADNLLKAIFKDSIEDVDAAIESGDAYYDNLKNVLRRNREGYTDKDIERLIDKYEIFEDFMKEKGYGLKYDIPRYKIIRPETIREGKEMTLDEISKQESLSSSRRKAVRNNMLIDIIWQTLTSESVSKLLMQPGNFDRVRHGSRQQKIMHNTTALKKFQELYKDEIKENGLFSVLQIPTKSMIKKLLEQTTSRENKKKLKEMLENENITTKDSTEFLDIFYEDNAEPVNPLDILDYVDMQKNLMDGNALIGMFAVNSSNHYKLQFCPVEIAKKYQLTIEGVTLTNIDLQDSPITGERIGRINAEFQAASPDNGKDPCLGDIGANTKTASKIGLLARLGLTPEMIGMLNTCDDFIDYSEGIEEEFNSAKITLPQLKTFNLEMNKLAEMIALYRTDREAFDEFMNINENRMFAGMFSKFMKSIKALSTSLSGVSKVSRSDSTNGALPVNLPEVIRQHFTVIDFMNEATSINSPIKGLDKLVNINLDAKDMTMEELREKIMESPVPRLQASYTLGIKSALSLCGDLFPGLSDSVISSVQFLRAQTQKKLTKDRDMPMIRRFIAELTMALLSQNSIFSTDKEGNIMDKRNYYIHDFPMKYKSFKEKKNADGSLAYPEVVNLNIIQRITNTDSKGLRFKNVGKVSDKSRKHFVEELESLLLSDKPEVVELAVDLFMYSYYDNGFQFGHDNFGIFFTTTYLKNMPRFIQSLNSGNAKLMNKEFNVMNYTYQFLLNHPKKLVPVLKNTLYTMDGNKLIPTAAGRIALQSGTKKTGEPVMFIQVGDKLWIKNGIGKDLYYTQIDYNKTNVPYYDMDTQFDEIKFSELKERGHVGYVDPKKLNKAQSTDNIPKEAEVTEFKEDTLKVPEEVDNLGDTVPQDEDDYIRDQVPEEEEEEEPADLEKEAEIFSQIDSKIDALAQRVSLMEAQLDQIPQEQVTDNLENYAPTNDSDVKMCEN